MINFELENHITITSHFLVKVEFCRFAAMLWVYLKKLKFLYVGSDPFTYRMSLQMKYSNILLT